MMIFMLLAHKPVAPLASFVEKLWCCEGYQEVLRRERVLPNGKFQLIINFSDALVRPRDCAIGEWGQFTSSVVVGIRSQFSVIHTTALPSVMGVLFWPGGARPFFDSRADLFYNESVPLDLVWGSMAYELRDRLREAASPGEKFRVLEKALLRRLKKRLELHAVVRYALGEFARAPHIRRVLHVAKEGGLSRRRFAHLFREQVGITPKLYCRIHRFQEALRQVASGAPVNWADVALAGGYCDQAHLAHEFREFSGLSPGAYLARQTSFANHVAMD